MKLSMCLAGIRPHFWHDVYKSALISCSRHSFEMIIISPYDLPEELKDYRNISHIKEWGSPVRASQIAALAGKGELMMFPCDDGVFIEDGVNQSIELFDSIGRPKDGVVLRYKEGPGMNAPSFPIAYWNPEYHFGIGPLQIGSGWKIAPQPMFATDYFKEIGGVDCLSFECMAFATHDLCYRMQKNGSVFHLSPIEVMNADNYGPVGVDHAPIHNAQTGYDQPKFFQLYSRQSPERVTNIDVNNWRSAPEKWKFRWGENG